MSIKFVSWALDQPMVGYASEKLVLVVLADHADTDGECWPSYTRMAERASVSEATVKRAVKLFVDWGLIDRERRAAPTGRTRSNYYTLRHDRRVPEEIASRGVQQTPHPTSEAEKQEKIRTSEAKKPEGYPSDTPPSGAGGYPPDTRRGLPQTPPYMNRHSETSPPSPFAEPGEKIRTGGGQGDTPATASDAAPRAGLDEAAEARGEVPATGSARKDVERDALAADFRKAEDTYQELNLLKFFGDHSANWKFWRKVSVEQRAKALSRLPNYLKGCKAQFARWSGSRGSERGRKPGVPSFKDYLADELYDSIGAPSPETAAKDEANIVAVRLCRAIVARDKFENPIWIPIDTAEWSAWADYFREHGVGLPERSSIFADRHELGAKQHEHGWRFPTRMPPATGSVSEPRETDEHTQISI